MFETNSESVLKRRGLLHLALGWAVLSLAPARAEDFEFFEQKVRPVLVEHCYKCHSAEAEKVKGGLRLDSRDGWRAGGESGPAIIPGEPDKSLLIKAVRYLDKDLQMPPKDQKLSETQIADLVAWVKMGAPDPRTNRVEKVSAAPKSAINFDEARKAWAFQAPKPIPAPRVKDRSWVRSPVDNFILIKLEAKNLKPAPPAEKRALLRRSTFDLIGLPPTSEEMEDFLADKSKEAFAKVVERLLASPHYGERWGRHWLDVVRYTDSFDNRGLGGEGDVPEAYRYRDWVVNALNHDLPYDRFIIDQIAGDLLATNAPSGFDPERLVATGVYAIGEWGTGDADKEKMLTDIVDDQVDLTGRAFLGLTLACARCHDHKFDPIRTEDYYGMAGIFFSSHILPNPGVKTAGSPVLRIPLAAPAVLAARKQHEARTAELEKQIEATIDQGIAALATNLLPQTARYLVAAAEFNHRRKLQSNLTLEAFADACEQDRFYPVPEVLRQWVSYISSGELALLTKMVRDVRGNSGVHALQNPGGADTPSLTANTTDKEVSFITITLPARCIAVHPSPKAGVAAGWKIPIRGKVRISGRVADADDKCGDGIEWRLEVRASAGVRTLASGAIPNGGAQQLSDGKGADKLEAVEVSAGEILQLVILHKAGYECDTTTIELEIAQCDGEKRVWNLTRDLLPAFEAGVAAVNPCGDNFGNKEVWHFYDLAKRSGQGEFPVDSTMAKWIKAAASGSALRGPEITASSPTEDERGNDAMRVQIAVAATAVQEALESLHAAHGSQASALTNSPDWKFYRELINPKGAFWSALRGNDRIHSLESREILASLRGELAELKKNPLPALPVAHGLQEGGTPQSAHEGIPDVKVHIRGRYDRLGEVVRRRFPQILAGEDQELIAEGSGRLQLANWIASPENPLTARVMVNRIWQHHFGEGIVRTPNNYGKLGTPPTHPELLDYLATEFVKSGWSIKAVHRTIMLSSAYQQSSVPQAATFNVDPDNLLFGRMNRRRLESEAIRDSLLAVAGNLDRTLGGPAIRDLSTNRRTLYVMTIRSDRATYQALFDAADPAAIVEKRLDSTVSPQALFLLNHPFALTQTKSLADLVLKKGPSGNVGRIDWLYRRLYGRPANPREKQIGLAALGQALSAEVNGESTAAVAWEQYCQVLLCANEFIYVD